MNQLDNQSQRNEQASSKPISKSDQYNKEPNAFAAMVENKIKNFEKNFYHEAKDEAQRMLSDAERNFLLDEVMQGMLYGDGVFKDLKMTNYFNTMPDGKTLDIRSPKFEEKNDSNNKTSRFFAALSGVFKKKETVKPKDIFSALDDALAKVVMNSNENLTLKDSFLLSNSNLNSFGDGGDINAFNEADTAAQKSIKNEEYVNASIQQPNQYQKMLHDEDALKNFYENTQNLYAKEITSAEDLHQFEYNDIVMAIPSFMKEPFSVIAAERSKKIDQVDTSVKEDSRYEEAYNKLMPYSEVTDKGQKVAEKNKLKEFNDLKATLVQEYESQIRKDWIKEFFEQYTRAKKDHPNKRIAIYKGKLTISNPNQYKEDYAESVKEAVMEDIYIIRNNGSSTDLLEKIQLDFKDKKDVIGNAKDIINYKVNSEKELYGFVKYFDPLYDEDLGVKLLLEKGYGYPGKSIETVVEAIKKSALTELYKESL